MSVFKISDYNPDDYIMRIFNAKSKPGALTIEGSLAGKWECCNIDETQCGDSTGKLEAYEIKTLKRK